MVRFYGSRSAMSETPGLHRVKRDVAFALLRLTACTGSAQHWRLERPHSDLNKRVQRTSVAGKPPNLG